MPAADPAFIFSVGHIQHPMQGILDAPMLAYGTARELHIKRQGIDVVAPLYTSPTCRSDSVIPRVFNPTHSSPRLRPSLNFNHPNSCSGSLR
jgi:hypothetical protein